MEGAKQKEAARMLGLTRHTICGWMKAYRQQGKKAAEQTRAEGT
jgi:transposase